LRPDGRDEPRLHLRAPYNEGDVLLQRIAELGRDDELLVQRDAPQTRRNMSAVFTRFVQEIHTRFVDEDAYYLFIRRLSSQVQLIHVQAPNPGQALLLFETTNNRGLDLAPSDLVKNVMFTYSGEQEYGNISSRWKDMDAELRPVRIDVTSFLRYVALGRYGAKVSAAGVAGWFRDQMRPTSAGDQPAMSPAELVGDLAGLARSVRQIREGKTMRGAPSPAFSELQSLNVKQCIPVLLAAVSWSDRAAEVLAQQLADFFFVVAVVRLRGQDVERVLPAWVEAVRALKNPTPEDVRQMLASTNPDMPRSLIAAQGPVFLEALGHLRYAPSTRPTNDTRRLRYLLRHLSAHVQGERWTKLAEIDGYRPEIEHILAQNPSEAALADFGTPATPDDIHGLGNLALLEHELNRKIGNGPFTTKAPSYLASKIQLTSLLAECDFGGLTHARQKVLTEWSLVSPGLADDEVWNPSSCEKRLRLYRRLASEVWLGSA
jgi:hypothetical protein